MAIEMTCLTCGSHDISKNGTSHRGKQNYKCRDCRGGGQRQRHRCPRPPCMAEERELKRGSVAAEYR